MKLIVFNKPFQVMCQFTDSAGRATLADYLPIPDVYPAGRLDFDSEGLLLLTDDGKIKARIAHPRHGLGKHYLVQVEGVATPEAARRLVAGVNLKDGPATAAGARLVDEPDWLWERLPPIRKRKHIPTSWMEIVLKEGRNRQVRRMSAAVGLPTLRLIRTRIGSLGLQGLLPGQFRELDSREIRDLLGSLPDSRRRASGGSRR
jgi:23S rRNA pseudouridine2457 synthase